MKSRQKNRCDYKIELTDSKKVNTAGADSRKQGGRKNRRQRRRALSFIAMLLTAAIVFAPVVSDAASVPKEAELFTGMRQEGMPLEEILAEDRSQETGRNRTEAVQETEIPRMTEAPADTGPAEGGDSQASFREGTMEPSGTDRQEEGQSGPSKSWSVTYDPNGGSGVSRQEQTSAEDVTDLPKAAELDFQRPGYAFVGWSTEPEGEPEDVIEDLAQAYTEQGEELILYAIWQQIENPMPKPVYTVTFQVDGAVYATVTVKENEKLVAPVEPSHDRYLFQGWYTTGRQSKRYNMNQLVQNSFTLECRWAELHKPYISGYMDGDFRPDAAITRGEAAQMLYNIAGQPPLIQEPDPNPDPSPDPAPDLTPAPLPPTIPIFPPGTPAPDQGASDPRDSEEEPGTDPLDPEEIPQEETEPPPTSEKPGNGSSGNNNGTTLKEFSDVPKDEWFYQAITYLGTQGMVGGYADGSFRPYDKITRAEFTVMVVNYEKMPLRNGSKFTDVPGNYWAVQQIETLASAGIVSGYKDGSYRPENLIDRSETVTLLNNYLGFDAYEPDFSVLAIPFTDVTSAHWAFCPIMECAVEHLHPVLP